MNAAPDPIDDEPSPYGYVEAFVANLMAREPTERFASADAARNAWASAWESLRERSPVCHAIGTAPDADPTIRNREPDAVREGAIRERCEGRRASEARDALQGVLGVKLFSIDYDHDVPGCAYAPPGVRWDRVPRSGLVKDWESLEFRLRDGVLCDYQSNDVGWRMCSTRMRELLEAGRDASDPIQWLPVNVVVDVATHAMWILHFPECPAVLDMDQTVFAPNGSIISPIYSASSIGHHRVFGEPGGKALATVLVEAVRNDLTNNKLTGLKLTPLRVTT